MRAAEFAEFHAMRGLFRWAKGKHVKSDPTVGIANPKMKKSVGFRPWEESDVIAYETKWPSGARQRVWLHVVLYTGGRRGDASEIGRQHIKNGELSFRTEKTDRQHFFRSSSSCWRSQIRAWCS